MPCCRRKSLPCKQTYTMPVSEDVHDKVRQIAEGSGLTRKEIADILMRYALATETVVNIQLATLKNKENLIKKDLDNIRCAKLSLEINSPVIRVR